MKRGNPSWRVTLRATDGSTAIRWYWRADETINALWRFARSSDYAAAVVAPFSTSRACTEPGCDRELIARGLCHRHYGRQLRTAAGSTPYPARDEAFWARVVEREGGCWIWTGSRTRGDYGIFHVDGSNMRVHRYAYEQMVGEIPDGLELDHLCRVRLCVNPGHLEPVTGVVNRARTRWTHCKQGHEFTPENTYTSPKGRRTCRVCRDAREARRYRRRQGSAA